MTTLDQERYFIDTLARLFQNGNRVRDMHYTLEEKKDALFSIFIQHCQSACGPLIRSLISDDDVLMWKAYAEGNQWGYDPWVTDSYADSIMQKELLRAHVSCCK
jgi:hypothetical protein